MSKIKLKNCPKCGSAAKIDTIVSGSITPYIVTCGKCNINRTTKLTYDEAIESWNKRIAK